MSLVRSDSLLAAARRAHDEVALELAALGVPGELRLTGAASLPGALTKGDVDLHLRVPADRFTTAVELLRRTHPVGSPQAWAPTLAVFDVQREPPTGLAVTPEGSEHDLRFTLTWQRLAADPTMLAEYNRIKAAAWGSADYEALKSAFFDSLVAG